MTTSDTLPRDGRASAEAIGSLIDEFAQMSAGGPGVTRLAYSPLERTAHERFREAMTELGLTVETDAVGNTIATLLPEGDTAASAAAIGTGSHLDSVPQGGRFDGIAGVAAAVEVARLAVQDGQPRRRPWKFVVFAGEEGARFGQACTGSRVIAGLTTAADLEALTDGDGVSVAAALLELGLRPEAAATAVWDAADWHAFVELHIEQGDVLERDERAIGVVDSISGSTRMRVHVEGRSSHTGGTPMRGRRDALVTASRCVLAGDAIANDPANEGTRVSVGDIDVQPNSITTIPGVVTFTVDIRDIDGERQRGVARQLEQLYRECAAENGTTVRIEQIGDTSPVSLQAAVVDVVEQAAIALDTRPLRMPSGASHDAQQISHIIPTGMIFVPSAGGLSHVPDEFTSAEQIARGTDVLLAAMRRLDAQP
ncbi:Zn-dependent hydrolase [Agrococcus sp. Marseille-Q4369]|uniref:Zn-dependent hydrolase n=1 Tax=Agrococcus sp. Marseille-Q4369 TaxID=2810513 RepID=UPI001B8B76B7|nr:Zn-dependent hydrolase [Agrococcus sp. Marseille-Q4369]QUW17825.1 Zn-dependent hydrolase [Agrococcus sp. Marseille-Q4369]